MNENNRLRVALEITSLCLKPLLGSHVSSIVDPDCRNGQNNSGRNNGKNNIGCNNGNDNGGDFNGNNNRGSNNGNFNGRNNNRPVTAPDVPEAQPEDKDTGNDQKGPQASPITGNRKPSPSPWKKWDTYAPRTYSYRPWSYRRAPVYQYQAGDWRDFVCRIIYISHICH